MSLPSDQSLLKLEAAVRNRVGFDPQSIGDQSLQQAVHQRMAERHISGGDKYVTAVLEEDAEFDSLLEELLVPETWFFRDRQPFSCVQHYATKCWRPSRLGDQLRVLSIPCSTGEEPYSIAMALLDAGLVSTQFHIDGVDLSRRSLRRAEEAVYTRSSFRGDEAAFPGLCDRFLKQADNQYSATSELRSTVRFTRVNLISPTLLADEPSYHIIFCRNVLIYLDEDARRTALANLHRLLLPDGFLYVGHVEARVTTEGPFGRFDDRFPFAFAPATAEAKATTTAHPSGLVAHKPKPLPKTVGTLDAAAKKSSATDVSSPQPVDSTTAVSRQVGPEKHISSPVQIENDKPVTDVATTLAAAQLAANAGRLDEATQLCQTVLEREPTCVTAVYLQGIVSEASGNKVEAERFYQKALYLDPRHKEALVHMMLMAQQRGDDNSAANFRRRLNQVQEAGD